MVRDGQPLGAVAAALDSPETAEHIALMEAATSGRRSALDAALLSLRRAGHDTTVLDGLQTGVRGAPASAAPAVLEPALVCLPASVGVRDAVNVHWLVVLFVHPRSCIFVSGPPKIVAVGAQ